MVENFYLGIHMEVCQDGPFYTTHNTETFSSKKKKKKLGFTPCKAEQPLQRMELQE